MRHKHVIGLAWLKMLAGMPDRPGHTTGAAAMDATIADGLRIRSRTERRRFAAEAHLSLGQLVRFSAQRARARQTHPGKRGKRARP